MLQYTFGLKTVYKHVFVQLKINFKKKDELCGVYGLTFDIVLTLFPWLVMTYFIYKTVKDVGCQTKSFPHKVFLASGYLAHIGTYIRRNSVYEYLCMIIYTCTVQHTKKLSITTI